MLSYWEYESFFKNIDILVIGSGIVGLHAALTCKEADPALRVVVAERSALPQGGSTRNAGFACFGSMTELQEDISLMGESACWALVESRWRGLQKLLQRVGADRMDYRLQGGYELFGPANEKAYQESRENLEAYNRALAGIIGEQRVFWPADNKISEFGFGQTRHLLGNLAEGHIHTGKMMRALLSIAQETGVERFNGMQIRQLEQGRGKVAILTQEGWAFSAKKVIVATNGFSRRLLPKLDVTPARNQVWVTEPIENLPFQGCFHYNKGYVYFRNMEHNQVLIGGARDLDLTGETLDEFGESDIIQTELRRLLNEVVLPGKDWKLARKWSGILGVGAVKQPIIQHYDQDIVVSVRLGGMGVAIGSWVGAEAARLALE